MANYVTFEQAKWLKEKGFAELCFYYYENGKLVEPYLENGSSTDVEFRVDLSDLLEYFNKWSKRISAPEQHQVVEWLRVNHVIWVLIDIDDVKHSLCNYVVKWRNEICLNENRGKGFNSPQEAYSAAFDYIKDNNLI